MADVPARYQPYRAPQGGIALANSVVLSLELLGTRALAAEDAQRNLETPTARFIGRVSGQMEANRQRPSSGGSATTWLLPTPSRGDASKDDPRNLTLGFHLITAGWMQLELSMMGLFARGGMAHGPLYADEDFNYGPALIDAYEIESRMAIFPRVVLAPTLAEFARQQLIDFGAGDTEVHRKLIAVDHDGLPFLNYLQSIDDEPAEAEAFLLNQKTHIVSRLHRHQGEPRVHLKYTWLADYHDRFCRWNFSPRHRQTLMIGASEGPALVPFGRDVPTPESPAHGGIPF